MKKITLYIPSLNGGGAERVMLTLANDLADKGLEIDLVLNKTQGPYLKDVSNKVNLIALGTSRTLTSIIPLSNYIKKHKPDVLLSAMNYVNIVAILSKILSCQKIKVILTEHDNLSSSLQNNSRSKLYKFAFKQLMNWAYQKADKIVAVSDGVAEDLLKNLPSIHSGKVITIYNPVVTKKLLKQKDELLEELTPFKTANYIIGVGRLSKQKNFPLLINAFAKSISQLQSDIKLVILGEGELRNELQGLINDLRMQNRIFLLGFSENPYAWIKNAKCFVLSSNHEGLPTVLIESMACGTPVISTDCPSGPIEILEGGKWGKLVPMNDIESLSKAITNVLTKPVDVSSKSLQERASRFNVENSVNTYLEILAK